LPLQKKMAVHCLFLRKKGHEKADIGVVVCLLLRYRYGTESETVNLANTSRHAAKGHSEPADQFHVSDPTLIAFNARAMGADVNLGKSGIVGMPKRAYGFANGKILFRNTNATSTGGTTGSGSVGTGSGIAAMGTGGSGIGINGKSPFAAPEIYGLPGAIGPSSPVRELRKQ